MAAGPASTMKSQTLSKGGGGHQADDPHTAAEAQMFGLSIHTKEHSPQEILMSEAVFQDYFGFSENTVQGGPNSNGLSQFHEQ